MLACSQHIRLTHDVFFLLHSLHTLSFLHTTFTLCFLHPLLTPHPGTGIIPRNATAAKALFATAKRWEWEDLSAPGSPWSPFGDGGDGVGGFAYEGGGMGGVENTAGIAPTLAGWYVD